MLCTAAENPGSAVVYGTADATPLWLITLHAAWQATGNRDLLIHHLKTAEACLAWIDESGDRGDDGFQEYQTRSCAGYENMGWKDSGDAVMYPEGSPVRGPKALCELQGYVYDAWLRMTHIYRRLDNIARADALMNFVPKQPRCSRSSTRPSETMPGVTMPTRSTVRKSRYCMSPQTQATACGPGLCLPIAPRVSSSG